MPSLRQERGDADREPEHWTLHSALRRRGHSGVHHGLLLWTLGPSLQLRLMLRIDV